MTDPFDNLMLRLLTSEEISLLLILTEYVFWKNCKNYYSKVEIALYQSVVTTTRHKRLGSPSENCSVMRLGIGEDGAKVLNIEQSRKERPSSLFLPPPPPQMFQKSSSAYCTQINNGMASPHNHFEASAPMLAPGYNSLPSWYGGLRQPPMMPMLFLEAAKALELESAPPPPQMVYNSHPADEEKRLAFTRGTLIAAAVRVCLTPVTCVSIIQLPRKIFCVGC